MDTPSVGAAKALFTSDREKEKQPSQYDHNMTWIVFFHDLLTLVTLKSMLRHKTNRNIFGSFNDIFGITFCHFLKTKCLSKNNKSKIIIHSCRVCSLSFLYKIPYCYTLHFLYRKLVHISLNYYYVDKPPYKLRATDLDNYCYFVFGVSKIRKSLLLFFVFKTIFRLMLNFSYVSLDIVKLLSINIIIELYLDRENCLKVINITNTICKQEPGYNVNI